MTYTLYTNIPIFSWLLNQMGWIFAEMQMISYIFKMENNFSLIYTFENYILSIDAEFFKLNCIFGTNVTWNRRSLISWRCKITVIILFANIPVYLAMGGHWSTRKLEITTFVCYCNSSSGDADLQFPCRPSGIARQTGILANITSAMDNIFNLIVIIFFIS